MLMMVAMWLAAGSRTLSDVLALLVRMRFSLGCPFSCDEADGRVGGCGEVIVNVFADCFHWGAVTFYEVPVARSTTMLWVEGLAPAIAEKFF